MAYIDLNQAVVPSLLPQTAPVATTGWDSNWIVGLLLGGGLLLGWMAMGYSKEKKKSTPVKISKGRKRKKKVVKKKTTKKK